MLTIGVQLAACNQTVTGHFWTRSLCVRQSQARMIDHFCSAALVQKRRRAAKVFRQRLQRHVGPETLCELKYIGWSKK